ncbi:imidazole glycerol phosphate synthase subunit HisH [Varunaivibrio sulfuroxidans]|uniref:Imidazole glycerol phosphate synthase subunit HisH n=1 Tax=Varunaivibrio sulfuroxidans TaxID=1773489 RepID=A0A4R3JHA2_9PROT|nr:imidazole glycerol phosphate synthase subunit HisH [Varunaivibrio sulfuroxidans]TCS64885.1 imidazole glycerol phosphate synthase subunit HisH [Varunaivibrio sulfuroxidans]WES29819.1 imidazole glycerol phosphate synthase subunit HisH [Varunaivibrio sulfuroxidans]
MVKAVIIDYGSGNLRSAAKAVEVAMRGEGLAGRVVISSRPEDVADASHVILPGVGAFADCMSGLRAVDGMIEAMTEAVLDGGRPFLGICVGMQLLADTGLEHGSWPGLGWIGGEVRAIVPNDAKLPDGVTLKVPHMGWNDLRMLATDHPVLKGVESGRHAYFVHSYHFVPSNPAHILAQADYGGPINAIVGRDNLLGTQFHPEKSQAVGLRFIANFLEWDPSS